MPNGIPSHDTFGWVFAALDPAAFARSFLGWAQALVTATDGAVVAIDGKTLRRSHDRTHDREALHLISAWSTAIGVVLGPVATDDRSNEITAISALLDALALEGTVVTIDAMGCQTAIATQIVAGGGDYVLALKDNQPTLRELVAHHFAVTATLPDPGQTHGRQGSWPHRDSHLPGHGQSAGAGLARSGGELAGRGQHCRHHRGAPHRRPDHDRDALLPDQPARRSAPDR
jgi:hypothetical protein